MADETPLWLFADQLGPHFHSTPELRDREIVIIESERALRRKPYHRQKLHLIMVGLRRLAAELGDRVTLVRASTYRAGLREFGKPVVVHEPCSYAADDLVRRLRADGLVEQIYPTPGFALARTDFAAWAQQRSRFLMEDFYREQRRRFGVLLEPDGEPTGGRWNFDAENRQGPPKGSDVLDVPAPWQPAEGDVDTRVRAELDELAGRESSRTVGADGPRLFAATADEADRALRWFLDERLPSFGTYQDAMLTADWAMSHALISVPLNLGLLDPLDVVEAAARRYRDGRAPLAGVEGFVRQVLGWREWIWHLYWYLGRDYRRNNHFEARQPLPRWWTDLDAGGVDAACLHDVLSGVHDRGYAHHIQRLMVLGNHALQRGYDPAHLTDWFATAFVDGFPWVMPANVIGMSQYADGGIVATKPYASGGAYINRMSDYCGSCSFDPKVRVGEKACPFTAGYWAWMARNADRLAGNHRMRQPLATMRRLADLDAVIAQEAEREQI